jgi:hypothetical protein
MADLSAYVSLPEIMMEMSMVLYIWQTEIVAERADRHAQGRYFLLIFGCSSSNFEVFAAPYSMIRNMQDW